jgi:hypothetical protein
MASDVISRGEVLSSPTFDERGDWSGGYDLAKDAGPGVVVGPSRANENVFIQSFPTESGAQYNVTVTAASVTGAPSTASVQINWMDGSGAFIDASFEYFGRDGVTASVVLTAPAGAAQGIVHVIPGYDEPVRYTQMSVFRLDPLQDFVVYRFLGVPGLEATGIVLLAVVLAAAIAVFRRRLLLGLPRILAAIRWAVPLVAVVICAVFVLRLEPYYEQAYDAQYHQGLVDVVMQWKSPSLDLGGNPMRSMGVQPLTNPMFSPTFLLGSLVPADIRIPAQAAFLAVVMLLISAALARAAGMRREDAYAVALIAQAYGWYPLLTWYQATLNATLGIFWQETAAASLLAVWLYMRIGLQPRGRFPWAALGLGALAFWYLISLPYMIAYLAMATGAACLGITLASTSWREVAHKVGAVVAILIALALAGAPSFILNLFLYTPQLFYRTTYSHNFQDLFFQNTSMLLSGALSGNWPIYVFFSLMVLGLVSALRSGNPYARRLAAAVLGVEIVIHGLSAINMVVKLVPLTFTYVEQVSLPLLSLFAGIGVWKLLELAGRLAEYAYRGLRLALGKPADIEAQR